MRKGKWLLAAVAGAVVASAPLLARPSAPARVGAARNEPGGTVSDEPVVAKVMPVLVVKMPQRMGHRSPHVPPGKPPDRPPPQRPPPNPPGKPPGRPPPHARNNPKAAEEKPGNNNTPPGNPGSNDPGNSGNAPGKK